MDTNRKATALVIASPHKVYGPESNDLVLELRKRGISKVLLCGMSANLCFESHLRELLEQGFEVSVVKDATALTNFGFIANAVLTTEEALRTLRAA
jgi:nicotinamidase-related amidase